MPFPGGERSSPSCLFTISRLIKWRVFGFWTVCQAEPPHALPSPVEPRRQVIWVNRPFQQKAYLFKPPSRRSDAGRGRDSRLFCETEPGSFCLNGTNVPAAGAHWLRGEDIETSLWSYELTFFSQTGFTRPKAVLINDSYLIYWLFSCRLLHHV